MSKDASVPGPWLLGIVLCIGVVAPAASTVQTESFVVQSTADAVDDWPGDGICRAQVGILEVCTLRAAVMEANALGAQYPYVFDIFLSPGTYQLTRDGTMVNSAFDGDLYTDVDLSIFGSVDGETIIEPGVVAVFPSILKFRSRLFDARNHLTLMNVTVRNFGTTGYNGNNETIRCWPNSGTRRLLIVRSKFLDNEHENGVVGTLPSCYAKIRESMFRGNRRSSAASEAGVLNLGEDAEIVRSALMDNKAEGAGPLAILSNSNASLQMNNTVLAGNSFTGPLVPERSVIDIRGALQESALKNVTIVNNDVGSADMVSGALSVSGNAVVANTIVASNSNDIVVRGGVESMGHNLFGSVAYVGDESYLELLESDALNVTDPGLQPRSFLPDSPDTLPGMEGFVPIPGGLAHDGGNPDIFFSDVSSSPACSQIDQAGRDRAVEAGGCDVGALELFASTLPPSEVFKNGFEN